MATTSSIPPSTLPFPSKFTLPTNVVVPRFPVGAWMKKAYWPLSVAIEAGPLICSVALAVFVGSVADVAMIFTLPPVGGVEGAVYIVSVPLAVANGLNDPQDPMGVQLQFTGVVAGSLTVVAAIGAVVAIISAPGGGVVRLIAISGGMIDTVWLFDFVVSVTDVAVIATLPPGGTVAGDVYTVVVPLAVLDRLNNPHEPLGMQLQVTPAFAESFVITAEMLAVADRARLAGGTAPKSTEIGKLTPPAANLVLSETEVAVIVTLPPVGAVAGAVYAVAAPLDVDAGLKVPQDMVGVQLQVTPLPAESFITRAETLAVPSAAIVDGGATENVTEMGCGVGPGPELEPDELPPPQPANKTATASIARMSEFLINSP